MKNILFILPWLPYPLNSGGRQAIYNGILAIKDQYNIFITYPYEGIEPDTEAQRMFLSEFREKVVILPYTTILSPEKKNLRAKIGNLLGRMQRRFAPRKGNHWNPYSYWIDELLPKPKVYIEHILSIIHKYNIDIVQSEMLRNLAIVQSIPTGVKTVFVHHELGFVRHELELESIKDDVYDGEAICKCAQNLEISQLNQYDCVVTLSPIDSQKLRVAGVKTNIADSFAIVNAKEPHANQTFHDHELTFVGPDIHGPNFLGVRWFLENCWQHLLSIDPEYHLTIIGKWSQQNISTISAQYPNVSFAGFVEDLDSALQGTIMIVPITVGSGIRMKILEASNIGVPFVSTTIGAEGIPIVNGYNGLIADSPEDFVYSIIKLKDNDLKRQLSANANQMVNEKYSLNALRENRLNIYNSLPL